MPLIGAVGDVSWRLAWLVLPLAASLLALALAVRLPEAPRRPATLRGDLATLVGDRVLAAWWLGSALVLGLGRRARISGALLIDSYAVSLTATGAILGGMFVAYLPGTLYFRRHIERSSQRLVIGLGLAAAVVAA